MERLTIEYEGQFVPKEICTINHYGEADDCETCGGICEESIEMGCAECPIQKAFKRLAEYEDLGLTPDQIKEIDRMYTEKCKRISYMSRHITEKLDDAKPPYNRILDSLEENRMQVGQISGLNKAINIVRECMENMDREAYSDVYELEFLRNSVDAGFRYGLCRCGTPVMSIHNYCYKCGVKLEWEGGYNKCD